MLVEAEKVKSLFTSAVEKLAPNQWNEFLDEQCEGNPKLRNRVQQLLDAHVGNDSLLDARPDAAAPTIDRSCCELPGTLIGPYKLLEQIGEGGMGLVYMAEQQRPMRRLVALKLIKPGMDSKQVIARFEAEKQALAMMDHENIAKVFEAGTTDSGRFYFAMELVRGVPINEFCDQQKLSVRERLELFIQVCQAVQHAHQKGIIHRDLKPSNVLVTLHDVLAVPKVIDFGIAKALGQQLTEHTLHTGFAQLVGTPLYMSPEQAQMNQLGVDTRSDIYSLGVMLYELLTGTTPFDKETLSKAGLDEMRRMIREDEPPRPSARVSTLEAQALSTNSQRLSTDPRHISATLRGELDWIVMKALEKDRSRRYESASALATDIQRYLSDEPVLACPPTTMYRFQKFARKHKPALATAAAIAACLILGTTVSAWQAVRATTAEAQANANEAQAKEAAAAEAQQRQRAEANEQKATAQRDEAQRQRDEVKTLADKLAAKERQLQRTLYTAHMNLARHAWETGGVDQVEELLAQHRPKAGEPDLRGFEWYYLQRLSHSELLRLRGHTGYVYQVVYSPDGKCLASASADKTVRVWDAETGQELLKFTGHSSRVRGVAFSPDGKRLASVAGELKVWDVRTGEEFMSLEASAPVAYSPDGKRIASSHWTEASPGNAIKVWGAQTGQELKSWKAGANYIDTLTFSPNGDRLASGDEDLTVMVFDAQTGRELLSLKDAGWGVEFTPDGKRLASRGFIFDAQTGEKLLTLKDVENFISLSPDGKRLAAGSNDRTLHIFDLATGEEVRTIKGGARAVTYSPDGRRLASYRMERSSDYTVKIWDADKDQDGLTAEQATGYNVAMSPDGRYMATGEKNLPSADQTNVRLWDPRTGQTVLTLKGHTAAVHGVAFSPDGKRLASGGTGRAVGGGTSYGGPNAVQELKIWDVQSGKELLSIKGQGLGVYSLAFSPDGKRVASTRKIWDAATGDELVSMLSAGRGWGQHVAFSPDGKYVVTGNFGFQGNVNEVKLWNAESGKEIRTLQGGGQGVAFSPDSKRLASAVTLPDQKVWVWDVESGRELYTVKGGGIGVIFSPDGKRLASGGKVWDAETGQELLSLKFHGYGIAFSSDGHFLACASGGGTKIWDATPLPEKAFIGLASPVISADNPTGTWKWSRPFGNNNLDFTLNLKQEGDKLTGTISERQELPIQEASFKDGKISFKVVFEFMGSNFIHEFTGMQSGDTITGKMEANRDGQTTSRDWEAKRQK